MNKNMRIHEDHEALLAYGRKNLFCSAKPITKQIFMGTDLAFCLINPHSPHDLRITTWVNGENMRIMRIHEEGLFIGFYLSCVEKGVLSRPKHEADMRKYEEYPHVFLPEARRMGDG